MKSISELRVFYWVLIALWGGLGSTVWAEDNLIENALNPVLLDPVLTERYQHLTQEFRCLVCQNQSIADSDAAVAQDLREKIKRQLQEGLSDQEIRAFWISRYGDFIELNPPLNAQTVLLWVAPFVFLTGLILNVFWHYRQQKRKS